MATGSSSTGRCWSIRRRRGARARPARGSQAATALTRGYLQSAAITSLRALGLVGALLVVEDTRARPSRWCGPCGCRSRACAAAPGRGRSCRPWPRRCGLPRPCSWRRPPASAFLRLASSSGSTRCGGARRRRPRRRWRAPRPARGGAAAVRGAARRRRALEGCPGSGVPGRRRQVAVLDAARPCPPLPLRCGRQAKRARARPRAAVDAPCGRRYLVNHEAWARVVNCAECTGRAPACRPRRRARTGTFATASV